MTALEDSIFTLSTELGVPYEQMADSWLPATAELVEPTLILDRLLHTPNAPDTAWRCCLLIGLLWLLQPETASPQSPTVDTKEALRSHVIGYRLFAELYLPEGSETGNDFEF